jgi:endonuclease YncB( thermonuclease family)
MTRSRQSNPDWPLGHRYIFENCRVLRVIDGDTLEVEIDIGFRFKTIQRIRLWGCNMAEARTPEGKAATAELMRWLTPFPTVCVETIKQDSFGRWLGNVHSCKPSDARFYELSAASHMSQWAQAQSSASQEGE